jgi:glyoxylate/hydroxypyruvate reductase A
VRGWSRTPREVAGVQCFSGEQGLQEFLAGTRILVCLLPLTPQTENILSRRTLGQLMPGGYLVNVARGGHLVEEDLLALLDEKHLAGATLDVFRTEPLPPQHPFWTHPQVTVTPHTSARTLREETIAQIAGKIRALERGEPLAGVVQPQRGY